MATIAIDVGLVRTKAAAFDAGQDAAVVVPLGEEGSSDLPSIVYVPTEGEVLAGEAAEAKAARDPAGAVRQLWKDFHLEGEVRRNGRRVDRSDVAALLLAAIRRRCAKLGFAPEDGPTGCCLVVSPGIELTVTQRKGLEATAALGGFRITAQVERPVAVARHWARQADAIGRAVVVGDIGGVMTELTLLRNEGGRFRLVPEVPPLRTKLGAEEVDDALWAVLAERGALVGTPDDLIPLLKQQLSRAKESLGREGARVTAVEAGGFAAAITPGMVRDCAHNLGDRLRDEIKRLAEAAGPAAADAPLLLAGGGALLPGLYDAAKEQWRSGPVHVVHDARFAAALGAVEPPPRPDPPKRGFDLSHVGPPVPEVHPDVFDSLFKRKRG
jgi:molecular chaperone DnaK (HSP70)